MRLLVVGRLSGQLAAAVKMAMNAGARVSHVEAVAQATHALRSGQGADLLMVDYELDIAGLIAANEAVAALLEDRGLPALYRVHERPGAARVARLADQLESLDAGTPVVAC